MKLSIIASVAGVAAVAGVWTAVAVEASGDSPAPVRTQQIVQVADQPTTTASAPPTATAASVPQSTPAAVTPSTAKPTVSQSPSKQEDVVTDSAQPAAQSSTSNEQPTVDVTPANPHGPGGRIGETAVVYPNPPTSTSP